jgi:hypothetical protein
MVDPWDLDGLDGVYNRKLERHNRGMLLVVADKGFGMMVETSGLAVGVEGREGHFDVGWRCVLFLCT